MALKRFIAGAVCPRCNDADSIFFEEVEGRRYRACVSCDFREAMRFEDQQREPETRVNKPTRDSEVQVVKLINPEKSGS